MGKASYERIRKPIVISTAVIFHCLLIFHLLFSPVIIVLASFGGIINASFITFTLIFLLSIFFGRAYCSWFCPGCGVQEVISKFVKKAKNNKAIRVKYVIFFIWICCITIGYLLNGINKIDITYGMTNVPFERKIILTVGAAILIVPITLVFGRFASCKYICWHAPFMIIGIKIRNKFKLPGLRIKAAKINCVKCNLCTKNCPMNINVMDKVSKGEINDNECILCGNCIDACKFKVLSFKISRACNFETFKEKI